MFEVLIPNRLDEPGCLIRTGIDVTELE